MNKTAILGESMAPFSPSRIEWGDDAAERDEKLAQYFVTPPEFGQLTAFQRSFVTGRKGSGKSALLKMLKLHLADVPKTCCVTIRPGNFFLEESSNWTDFPEATVRLAMAAAWQMEMCKQMIVKVGESLGGTLARGELQRVRKFARTEDLVISDPIEAIAELLQKLLPKRTKAAGVEIEFRPPTPKASINLPKFEMQMDAIANKGYRLVFLLDDLDKFWTGSDYSLNLLLGLLQAKENLERINNNIKCVIFLRDDVKRILLRNTSESDKLRDDVQITWSRSGLRTLLANRIRHGMRSQSVSPPPEDIDVILQVFPEKVGTFLFENWLESRTFGRPRDVIQFAKLYCRELAFHGGQPLSEVCVDVEAVYSDNKLQDLCTEFSVQFPELVKLFEVWSNSHAGVSPRMNKREFYKIASPLINNMESHKGWIESIRKSPDPPKSLLILLYEIGVVGDVMSSDRIVYRDHSTEPKFEKIEIHPMFRSALRCARSRSAAKSRRGSR